MLEFMPALMGVTTSVAVTIIGVEALIDAARELQLPARVSTALGQHRPRPT